MSVSLYNSRIPAENIQSAEFFILFIFHSFWAGSTILKNSLIEDQGIKDPSLQFLELTDPKATSLYGQNNFFCPFGRSHNTTFLALSRARSARPQRDGEVAVPIIGTSSNWVLSDDVTKMIFLNLWFYSIVRNNVPEKSSHTKYWLFSVLNSWDMGVWSSNCFIFSACSWS